MSPEPPEPPEALQAGRRAPDTARDGAGRGVGDPLTDRTAAREVVELLAVRGETVAAAESLTAGLWTATLAGVPGASAVLRGGLVVYATDLKGRLAGVPEALLGRYGPVSAETAQALAEGARARCSATWGIGLTGVAGPAVQDGRAVGTVYIGVCGPPAADAVGRRDGAVTDVLHLARPGLRWNVRKGAVDSALEALRDRLRERVRHA